MKGKYGNVPQFLQPIAEGFENVVCSALNNPKVWDDTRLQKTLRRTDTKSFDINEARSLIKDHMAVISEEYRQGNITLEEIFGQEGYVSRP